MRDRSCFSRCTGRSSSRRRRIAPARGTAAGNKDKSTTVWCSCLLARLVELLGDMVQLSSFIRRYGKGKRSGAVTQSSVSRDTDRNPHLHFTTPPFAFTFLIAELAFSTGLSPEQYWTALVTLLSCKIYPWTVQKQTSRYDEQILKRSIDDCDLTRSSDAAEPLRSSPARLETESGSLGAVATFSFCDDVTECWCNVVTTPGIPPTTFQNAHTHTFSTPVKKWKNITSPRKLFLAQTKLHHHKKQQQ